MRLAIVKLSALGDIVHAMVILQYIIQKFPNTIIDWFVEEKFTGILENNTHINKIYKIKLKNNKSKIFYEYKKLKSIAKENSYDLIIDLQGLIKSAIVSKILGKNTVGFDKNSAREPLASLFYSKSFYIAYDKNVIMRNLDLTCKALNFNMPDVQTKDKFLFFKEKNMRETPILLLHVGSSWQSKVYPKEHFLSIVKSLHVKTFISWGNDIEAKNAKFICDNSEATLLRKLNLNELKQITSKASLVIGADSGPTHLAWALNVPSITIFGSTPSYRNTLKTNINLTIDCGKKIDPKNLNKNDFCIQKIKPEDIIVLAKKLLKC